MVRVRTSKLDTLLIGIIKPYNFYYWHFLLRSLVSEIFAGPFHQAKAASSSFTVYATPIWHQIDVANLGSTCFRKSYLHCMLVVVMAMAHPHIDLSSQFEYPLHIYLQ